ncbi:MAG: hypothetical protein HY835_10335 [Anaerolineae bacterium]|nr:hypothetical protein [Anaerolineae bacterium]
MKLVCPSCGAVHSAEGWSNDTAARQCLIVVAELPAEVGKRALPYLAMFRPTGSKRGLTWEKALRLLHTLRQMVMDSHIQWDRLPARPNSATAWAQALEEIVQRPPARLPLTSHGYLKRIAYDAANDMDRAKEVRHNADERAGRLPEQTRPHVETPMAPPMSVEEMRAIRERNMGKRNVEQR